MNKENYIVLTKNQIDTKLAYPILIDNGIDSLKYKKCPRYALPDPQEVKHCKEWLNKFTRPSKQFYDNYTSYGLKAKVEQQRIKDKLDYYVSNGSFILACLELEHKLKHDYESNDNWSPNVLVNIELKEDDWQRVQPKGFSAWLFKQVNENHRIADLANDAIVDEQWPRTETKLFRFWQYLLKTQGGNVDTNIMECLQEAWEYWSDCQSPIPTSEIWDKVDRVEDFICSKEYDSDFDDEEFEDDGIFEVYYENNGNNNLEFARFGRQYMYILLDKTKVCYVGQTKNPQQRLEAHIINPGSIDKLHWTSEIIKKGYYPRMIVIDAVPKMDANLIEQSYIYAFSHHGAKLFNNNIF